MTSNRIVAGATVARVRLRCPVNTRWASSFAATYASAAARNRSGACAAPNALTTEMPCTSSTAAEESSTLAAAMRPTGSAARRASRIRIACAPATTATVSSASRQSAHSRYATITTGPVTAAARSPWACATAWCNAATSSCTVVLTFAETPPANQRSGSTARWSASRRRRVIASSASAKWLTSPETR